MSISTPSPNSRNDRRRRVSALTGVCPIAQDVVSRSAPSLQRLQRIALEEGGWFDLGHDQAVSEATSSPDHHDRVREVRTLVAEETRLGMLVGVAIGFELAQELARNTGE